MDEEQAPDWKALYEELAKAVHVLLNLPPDADVGNFLLVAGLRDRHARLHQLSMRRKQYDELWHAVRRALDIENRADIGHSELLMRVRHWNGQGRTG